MLRVNLSSLWSDDTSNIIKGVSEAIENLKTYRESPYHTPDMLLKLGEDIREVCCFWTGSTYVGSPKRQEIKSVFQSFFDELVTLLLAMKDSKLDFEKKVANDILYRGVVYRYLGHDCSTDKVVVPDYDNIYVSWNKEEENSYLLSKLYGPVTKITCVIAEPLYGIDLEILECCRGTEREVVFPTIERYITEVKYLGSENETGIE